MRIILVCNHPKYLSSRKHLVNSLKDDNDLYLAAPFRNFPDEYRSEAISSFKYKTIDFYLNNHGVNPFRDFKTCLHLYKTFRKLQPDFVLNFTAKPNIYSTLMASLLGIKTINNITGLGTLFTTNSFSSKIGRRLYLFSQSLSTRIFFQNADDMQLFTGSGNIRIENCTLIPGSGVDLKFFEYTPPKQKPDGKTDFLYVGKLFREKGIFEMFEAFGIIKGRYPDVTLTVIGTVTGPKPQEIARLMTDLEKEGVLKYYGEQEDVRTFIRNADCIILPSYREGTPRSLLEAASTGRPVIASYVPGCKGVIDDGYNGYFFAARDVNDITEKIEKIIKTPYDKRVQLGKNGRIKMEKEFDEVFVAREYLNAINQH